jgi:phage-related protein
VKPLRFLGSSRRDLLAFPEDARRKAGYQLDLVQWGNDPDDWKPMKSVGAGVKEVRIREVSGAFRIIYLAAFAEAVYVLHAFQKKTGKTGAGDIDLAASRFRELVRTRKS